MEHWWSDHVRVLGVFQGGGAKGVAYAGALRALDERGLWFSQVAGSSAGAITAVLVAAGVHPNELDATTRAALASVKRQAGRLTVGAADTLFSTRKLSAWLDRELRQRVRGEGATAGAAGVTFAELEAASGIPCHVVALNLATGHPVVFSGASTPDAPVVAAVLASSAIPGALRGGRAVVSRAPASRIVHHLVDGGAWANYPSFVFRDPAFRSWAHLDDPDAVDGDAPQPTSTAPLVGFALDSPRASAPAVDTLLDADDGSGVEFDEGAGRSSKSRLAFALSWLLGSRVLRATFLIAALGLGFVLIEALPAVALDWQEVAMRDFGLLGPLLAISGTTVVLFGIAAAAMAAVGALGFGRMLAHSALPSANALLGVATRVAPWAHCDPNAMVLRLTSRGVKTTAFNLGEEEREPLVRAAHADAAEQLASERQRLLAWGADSDRLDDADDQTLERPPNPAPQAAGGFSGPFGVAVMIGLVAAAGYGLWLGVTEVAKGNALIFYGSFAVPVTTGALLGSEMLMRASRRRAEGAPPRPRSLMAAAIVGIVLLFTASLSIAAGGNDSASFDAHLVAARAAPGEEVEYSWRADDARKGSGTLTDRVRLTVGEAARIRPADNGGWELAREAGDRAPAVAAVLGLVALAILMAAADALLYRRFRRKVESA